MTLNSPYVSRLTRQWLLREHGHRFGKAMAEDLIAVVYHHRVQNLCGPVYDAAHVFELPEEQCVALGSWADLFYCCVGALDDIQDGDADDYMPWPVWRQVAAAMGLLSLSEQRLLEICREDRDMMFSVSCQTTKTHYEMVAAQYAECMARKNGYAGVEEKRTVEAPGARIVEVLRSKEPGYAPPWGPEIYEQHALWTAGAELALFLGGVGAAAGGELTATLRAIGYACGVLLQIRVDSATDDERVTVLPGEDVDRLRQRHTELFFQHAEALPEKLVAMLLGVAGIEDRP